MESTQEARVARGVAENNSSFLSALQTSLVLHISMNAQLTYEPIVLTFQPKGNFFPLDLFADVMSVHNRNMKHARAVEFDQTTFTSYVIIKVRILMANNFSGNDMVIITNDSPRCIHLQNDLAEDF